MSGPDTAGMREALAREMAAIDDAHREVGTKCSCGYAVPDEELTMWMVAMQVHRWRARADVLLPVVQRLAVEKAAEALALAQIRTILAAGSNPRSTVEAIRRALAAAAQPTDGRTGE